METVVPRLNALLLWLVQYNSKAFDHLYKSQITQKTSMLAPLLPYRVEEKASLHVQLIFNYTLALMLTASLLTLPTNSTLTQNLNLNPKEVTVITKHFSQPIINQYCAS